MDDYVDDANYFLIIPLHLHLPTNNQEDIDAPPKDKPKNYLLGFISNSFILFWSIYYTAYIEDMQQSVNIWEIDSNLVILRNTNDCISSIFYDNN